MFCCSYVLLHRCPASVAEVVRHLVLLSPSIPSIVLLVIIEVDKRCHQVVNRVDNRTRALEVRVSEPIKLGLGLTMIELVAF